MIRTAALAFIAIILLASPVNAHNVSVYAYEDGDAITAEGYYMDGKPCAGCEIKLVDAESGKALAEGRTDSEGRYIFADPGTHHLAIRLVDRVGHAAGYELGEEGHPDHGEMESDHHHEVLPGHEAPDHEMEERLEALRDEIARLRKEAGKPGLTEALGGIGYIVGVFGLWAWMRSRKKENTRQFKNDSRGG